MRFAEDSNDARYLIRAYAPGRVTVNEDALTRSLIVSAEQLIRDWPPQGFEELTPVHLRTVIELRPEILLLGTGAQLRFPHPSLLAELHSQGIGIEVMDTAAACRTYNILVSEGRRVAAALLMI
ncbi:MAG: Mth938-like domain-containing protein [Gammaproteobacteria bacterium]|nr:Mth938-like domain-containing protein [Gammaproteobacteria bacterium]